LATTQDKRVYLFHGDDAFALAEARQKLEAKLLDPAWREFNLTALSSDTPIRKIVEALLAMPFGGGARLVVVKEPAFLAGKSEDPGLSELERVLDAGVPDSAALLLLATKLDGRLKLAKKIAEIGIVREFAQPKPWQVEEALGPWIEQLTNERQRRIAPDAVSALLAATGGDRYRVQREVEKLTTYVQEGARITTADVRALVAGGEVEVFALTEALARRQAGAALVALDRLLTGDHVLKVVAACATILRGWWRLKLLSEQGLQATAIAKETGARSDFKVRKDLEMLRGWQSSQLERALTEVLEVDLAIKAGRWTPEHHRVLMERAIANMLA
jgi:DNA polymerase-3 subunit delta